MSGALQIICVYLCTYTYVHNMYLNHSVYWKKEKCITTHFAHLQVAFLVLNIFSQIGAGQSS